MMSREVFFNIAVHIAEQFLPCTNHRVQLSVRARMENVDRETVLKQILEETPRPKLQEKPRA